MTTEGMPTRRLENNQVVRSTVRNVSFEQTQGTTVLFRTEAVVSTKRTRSSADSEMMSFFREGQDGETVEGRLSIELLWDDTFRVRYAQRDVLEEHDTRMVVADPPGPSSFAVHHDAHGSAPAVIVATAAGRIAVHLSPFRIEVTDASGHPVCGIGGPEKDYFANWDAFNTGINRVSGTEDPIATECFDLRHDECIYGLGEQFISLDKVGQTVDLDMMDALGVTTPRSYKNVPFFISNRGYGAFLNHSSRITCWVGSMSATDVQVGANDDFLDYYVMIGSIKDVLRRFTDITGKGTVPPRWTFGYWQSKISYSSADETLDVARKLREAAIPCDVLHLDTHWFKWNWYCDLEFDTARFPDPRGYMEQLAAKGFKVSLWQLPYIPEGSALFNALAAVDGFVKDRDGSIYDIGICFTPSFEGVVGVVDYTNPAAVRVHQDAFRKLFRAGASIIKSDFGEAAPVDGVYHDGTPGSQMHNLYPLLYNQAISQVTREETGDGTVWARSAWAGSQRFPIHWGGDNSPNIHNLYPQLQGGLSLGLSGFQFWSQDIGGFLGDTNEELLIRWMQMGVFLSHSRIHGSGDRELYKFSPNCVHICREYLELRYRLLPYIISNAHVCVRESLPFARALVVEYQDDPNVARIGHEYLFGDGILVAPMMARESSRRVYLPRGTWTDWWTNERITGPCWLDVEVALEMLPLYIREGAVIPMGPVMNYVDEKPMDRLKVRIGVRTSPGVTTLPVRVNDETSTLTYEFDGKNHTLTWTGSVPVETGPEARGTVVVRREPARGDLGPV